MSMEGKWLRATATKYDIQSPFELPLTCGSEAGEKKMEGRHWCESGLNHIVSVTYHHETSATVHGEAVSDEIISLA
jgi:hypothetical protein